MKKIYLIYGLAWVLALSTVFFFSHASSVHREEEETEEYHSQFTRGQIADISGSKIDLRLPEEGGKIVKTELSDFYLHDDYKPGDKVSVYVSQNDAGEKQYDVADYYHMDGLIFSFIIFALLAIIVARKKGFYSIISVILSLFFFYGITVNAIQSDIPIIIAGIIYVFLITVLTIPLIHGFNKKSASAIIAVNVGYIIGFLLTYFFTAVAKIGNTPTEHFRTLFIQFPDIEIRQILIISLFLGAVGALIDVAVSICSAVFEGIEDHARATFKKVYNLGMSVGRDILGSMVNTLLIAYLAGSFPFLVLITLGGFHNPNELINYDFIALELTRIFIGATSIILLIPITSVVTAYLLLKQKTIK